MSDPVSQAHRSASGSYPRVALPLAAYRSFVAALAPGPVELATLHLEDLFLACAAALGDAAAVSAIDAVHLRQVPAWVARQRPTEAELDELTQRLREHLFVRGEGRRPRIAEYGGRGPLGAWLRVLALRLFASERRGTKQHASLDDLTQHAFVGQSPEHQLAKARYQDAFDQALRDAFAELTSEQRALFRFQFGKGLTLDQIATVLGTHRATVARHIASAREELWRGLTNLLRERLQLGAREVDELLAEWRSKLELSLSGLLRESTESRQ